MPVARPSETTSSLAPKHVAGPVKLPPPRLEGLMAIERCLASRRSCRNYSDTPLTLEDIGQLLWAAQGITCAAGLRTCPSPKAVYPLRIDLVAGDVRGLGAGIYRYDPDRHALLARAGLDRRRKLSHAALDQVCIEEAAAVIVISADYRSLAREFGHRSVRLAPIEAGHAAQNVALEATARGLGTIGVGVFDDALVKKALSLAENEDPLFLIALGNKE